MRNAPFDSSITAITFLPGAGCDFADVKDYANNYDVSYIGATGDIIQTNRHRMSLQAVYNSGRASLAMLPKDFDKYSVTLNSASSDINSDARAVLQWQSADSIQISDNSNLAFALLQHMDALNNMNARVSIASH